MRLLKSGDDRGKKVVVGINVVVGLNMEGKARKTEAAGAVGEGFGWRRRSFLRYPLTS